MMHKRVVIKIGGNAFDNKEGFYSLAQSIKALNDYDFSIVHGGGKEISKALNEVNRKPQFVDGLRITPKEDMELVEKLLSHTINKRIADYLRENSISSIQMSGKLRDFLS